MQEYLVVSGFHNKIEVMASSPEEAVKLAGLAPLMGYFSVYDKDRNETKVYPKWAD